MRIILSLCIVLLALPATAQDEVEQAVKEALELYRAGDYAAAAGNLDYAAQLVRQKKGEKLTQLLPDPLPGWQAEEAEGEAFAGAMMGGGVTVSRSYYKDDAQITLSIITDSPMMMGFMSMLNNPMMMGQSGMRMERIGGERAIVQSEGGEVESINLVLDNRILIQAEGSGASKEDLVSYLEKLNFDKIRKL